MKVKETIVRTFNNGRKQVKFLMLAIIPVITVMTTIYLFGSIGQSRDATEVNLDDRIMLSQVQGFSSDNYHNTVDDSLQVAIAGVLSPSRTLEYYQDLLIYLGLKLDQKVKLILKPTYSEINDLVRGERVDVAFVCSLAYTDGNDDFGMELLVVPQMYGETVYYSYLIAPQDSPVVKLHDLRNRNFAFTDPLSNSGHLAPTYQLSLLGETPTSFFNSHIYTYSHDLSITAVADKLVDGAAVDSLVYDQLIATDVELATRTKIVTRWGPYGIPPVVVNPELNHQLKKQLRDIFMSIHESSEGKEILMNLAIDKFVVMPENTYETIREMKVALGW
jgi:phosphonate transport system substrate-binding protein